MTAAILSGATSVHTSGASNTHREDLSDILTNIDKERNVFMSVIGKGECKALLHEWPEDTDDSATSNAQVDGADAEFSEISMPSKLSNRVQLAARWFAITSLQESVDKAGRKSEVAYQTAKKLRALARDIEYAILNNTSATAFASETAGTCYGLKHFGAAASGANLYEFSGYDAGNLLTWDILNDRLEAAHEDYGEPSLILAPSKQKRLISSFDQNNRIAINADAAAKKIVAAVDYLETDFGMLQVRLVYFLYAEDSSGNDSLNSGASPYYDYLSIIDPKRYKLCFLKGHGVKSERLAKTGLSEKVQLSAAFTLEARNIKGDAMIRKLTQVI